MEEDVYEQWREQGPKTLAWDASKQVPDVGTVAEEMTTLVEAVRSAGHELTVVNIRDDLGAMLRVIEAAKPEIIFNLVEFFGEDAGHEAHIAGVYEMLELQYTGSRPAALMSCQRKHRTKAILRDAGVPTAKSFVVSGRRGHHVVPTDHGLRFPVIVKPSMEDASGGIDTDSVIYDPARLAGKVDQMLADYEMPILVEEYIDGRELHCAILGTEALPLYEMTFAGGLDDHGKALPRIITYRAKWDPYSKDHEAVNGVCPPDNLEAPIAAYVQSVAIKAFKALGCRDYARVDMRLDPVSGEAYVLEVNPNPDLADGCAFANSVRASGRTYAEAINAIVEMALARGRNRPPRPEGPSDTLLREYLARPRS